MFAIVPINLWYNDFLWLNPSPMASFILLAIYAFLSKKYKASLTCLAIATLFKQIASILFPVFLVTLLSTSNRKDVIQNAVLYCTTCFFGSLPYIITIPAYYLWSLGVPGFGSDWQGVKFTYYFGSPTNLAIVLGEDAYNPSKPLLWTTLLLSLVLLCWRTYKARTNDIELITHILYALLFFHAFFPRGIYKYYYAAITPFNSMFIRSRRGALVFLGLNILILIIPRYLTPWLSVLF